MDMGHLHLMLNHLPVLGAPALLALLAWGLAGGIPTVTRGALWLTVALAVVTGVVYLTGEAAEELVEGLPTFQERLVEYHEEVALWATLILTATGCLAAAALWRSRRWPTLSLTLTRVVLVGLLASTAAVGVTAWTGGPIGHPELRPGRTAAQKDLSGPPSRYHVPSRPSAVSAATTSLPAMATAFR